MAAAANPIAPSLHEHLMSFAATIEHDAARGELVSILKRAHGSAGLASSAEQLVLFLGRIKSTLPAQEETIDKLRNEVTKLFPKPATVALVYDTTRLLTALKPAKISAELAVVRLNLIANEFAKIDPNELLRMINGSVQSADQSLLLQAALMLQLCASKVAASQYCKAPKLVAVQTLLQPLLPALEKGAIIASIQTWRENSKEPLLLPPNQAMRRFDFLQPLLTKVTPPQLKAIVQALIRSYPEAESIDCSHTKMTPSILELFTAFKNLKKLSLAHCSQIASSHLESLATATSLEELTLSFCPLIEDEDLTYLQNMKQLRQLYLVGNHRLTDRCAPFFMHFRELIKIDLSACSLSDAGIKSIGEQLKDRVILQAASPSFQQLGRSELKEAIVAWEGGKTTPATATHLYAVTSISWIDLLYVSDSPEKLHRVFLQLVQHCPHIESIDCTNWKIGADTVRLFAQFKKLRALTFLDPMREGQRTIVDAHLIAAGTLSGLQELTLTECERFSPNAIASLQALASLTSLDCSSSAVSDEMLVEIAKMRQLRSLKLNYCTSCTAAGLKRLNTLHNLQVLELSSTNYSTSTIRAFAKMRALHTLRMSRMIRSQTNCISLLPLMPQLRTLDLSHAEEITSDNFEALAKLTQLDDLNLSDCISLTDNTIFYFMLLKNLKRLDVRNCMHTTEGGIREFQKRLPKTEITIHDPRAALATALSTMRIVNVPAERDRDSKDED